MSAYLCSDDTLNALSTFYYMKSGKTDEERKSNILRAIRLTNKKCWYEKQKVVENDIPQTSVRTLIFRPQSNISIWAKALGLDIGAFVKTNVLTPSGTTESYDLFIENIQHSVDARSKTWTWKIGLSPAETGAWILGVSKLGIDTNISYT